eukprot:8726848-Pyramimonas_sp.AAC.1
MGRRPYDSIDITIGLTLDRTSDPTVDHTGGTPAGHQRGTETSGATRPIGCRRRRTVIATPFSLLFRARADIRRHR